MQAKDHLENIYYFKVLVAMRPVLFPFRKMQKDKPI
jgi:hypothetical protein